MRLWLKQQHLVCNLLLAHFEGLRLRNDRTVVARRRLQIVQILSRLLLLDLRLNVRLKLLVVHLIGNGPDPTLESVYLLSKALW